jgi:hypothetical protein
MRRTAGRGSSSSAEATLQVTVPQATKRSLKVRAAERGETMRVIVLKALAAAGIEVPETELQDHGNEK